MPDTTSLCLKSISDTPGTCQLELSGHPGEGSRERGYTEGGMRRGYTSGIPQNKTHPFPLGEGVPVAAAAAPSLVSTLRNSTIERDRNETSGKRPGFLQSFKRWMSRPTPTGACPNGHWIYAACEHDTIAWLYLPCKRRDCPVCGPVGRYRIAQEIAYGVRELWPCAWVTLTFTQDVCKEAAVKELRRYVRWLRRRLGTKVPGKGKRMKTIPADLQYVATYELTKVGRLHINLIIGSWSYIPQGELQAAWGARVYVCRVRDDLTMGNEASKASPGALGGYMSKIEQAVPTDRRVSFSRGWPRLPGVPDSCERRGDIHYAYPLDGQDIVFQQEKADGYWYEVRPGEWRTVAAEKCDCFELKEKGLSPLVNKRAPGESPGQKPAFPAGGKGFDRAKNTRRGTSAEERALEKMVDELVESRAVHPAGTKHFVSQIV